MKIYYAHHQWKYGTPIEDYETSLITKHFSAAIVVNPNGAVDQTLTSEQIMDECFYLVDDCDVLVFSSVDGVVGKGVYDEVSRASDQFKPVYYIHNNSLNPFGFDFDVLSDSTTKRIYATVHDRHSQH